MFASDTFGVVPDVICTGKVRDAEDLGHLQLSHLSFFLHLILFFSLGTFWRIHSYFSYDSIATHC